MAEDRIHALFVENADAVFNVAFRVLWNRSDAEDVVQRSFVKAQTHLGQLRDRSRTRPWLLQIAYREALAVLNQRRQVATDPAELCEVLATTVDPAEWAVDRDVAKILQQALLQLNPDQRKAVILRDLEQLSMRQVASELSIDLSAAKMRVQRGRLALRTHLATKGVR